MIEMAISDAQKRAVAKYKESKYEQVKIEIKKGYRDRWKAAAGAAGKSLAQFITDAVEKEIENECL